MSTGWNGARATLPKFWSPQCTIGALAIQGPVPKASLQLLWLFMWFTTRSLAVRKSLPSFKNVAKTVATAEAPAAKMKFNSFVASHQSKNQKRHISALPHAHRKIMSSPLTKELRQKSSIRSVLIWKDENVQILWRPCKQQQTGNTARAYGEKYVTCPECSKRKLMAQLSTWAFSQARCLSLDKKRTKTENDPVSRQVGKARGRHKEETIEKMQESSY